MRKEQKERAVAEAMSRLGRDDEASRHVLSCLWEQAFEDGRLAALDEFQDRFCVCMK